MLKVIANSTPIIVLCGIGKLDILRELYGEVAIPTAVYQEVTVMEDSACMQVWNAAKKTAKYLGLTVTGTLGILLKAKSQGIVQRVDILLAEMKRNGFYLDSRIEAFVLEQAGESPAV